MSLNLTVTVHGDDGSAICRDIAVCCLNDLLTAISSSIRRLQVLSSKQTSTHVVLQPVSTKRTCDTNTSLEQDEIEIINICGRVTHLHTNACVVRHACHPLITKSRDSFGMRTGIFTTFGNFMTSENNKTTLFRGAKRCRDVLMIIDHLFDSDNIDSIVMHMLVAKAKLPHPVIVDAKQFEYALLTSTRWDVAAVTVMEDMTYMKPLHLQLRDGRATSVLLHIYSSGVLFFFVTCPATPLSVEHEARIAEQCGDIYACIAAVC
jgi:hypothetical protein